MKNNYQMKPLTGTPLDYANQENWMFFEQDGEEAVDVFYLYPTSASPDCLTDISEVDETMKHMAMLNYLGSGSAFSSYANIYAPYYRQLSALGLSKAKTPDEMMDLCRNSVACTDVFAALDYFFENISQDRPYILAGQSQGACLLKLALAEYMRLHPEYLVRMAACYAIGFYFPDTWFEDNPYVRKATGESDAGVLISWNTEKPGCIQPNFVLGNGDSFVINPLNWQRDETPASIEENLGSAVVGKDLELKIVEGQADATIDLKRGALICSTSDAYIKDTLAFGEGSFHFSDWSFYYENIQENGKLRIAALKKRNSKLKELKGKINKDNILSMMEIGEDGKLGMKDVVTMLIKSEEGAVDRATYLQEALAGKVDQAVIDQAIETNPIQAGVSMDILSKLAEEAITAGKKSMDPRLIIKEAKAKWNGKEKFLKNGIDVAKSVVQNRNLREMIRATQKFLYLYGFPGVQISEGGTIMGARNKICMLLAFAVISDVENADQGLKALAQVYPKMTNETFIYELMEKDEFKAIIQKWRKKFLAAQAVFMVADSNPLLGQIVRKRAFFATFEKGCKRLKSALEDTALTNTNHEASEIELKLMEKLSAQPVE